MPAEETILKFQYESDKRWSTHHPLFEQLKQDAKAEGLWNLFLPLISQKHLPPYELLPD